MIAEARNVILGQLGKGLSITELLKLPDRRQFCIDRFHGPPARIFDPLMQDTIIQKIKFRTFGWANFPNTSFNRSAFFV